MARGRKLLVAGALALLAASWKPAFVPGPRAPRSNAAVAASPALTALVPAAPAAFADSIADASKKFSEATYPIAEKFDWGGSSAVAKYIADASASNPRQAALAVEKLLEVGLTMDPKLVRAAVEAHSKALDSAKTNAKLMASKEDFAAVNEALARMIASADKQKFAALRTAFPESRELQGKLFAGNNGYEAEKAYESFKALTSAVRDASINGAKAPIVAEAARAERYVGDGPVGRAAKKFSEATYPIMEKLDWGKSPEISKYIETSSAKNPKMMADGIDKTLEVALTMNQNFINDAVFAHVRAIKGALNTPGFVAERDDFARVNLALAKMIGSADPAKFKALLTAFPGNADLQMALFAANNPEQAKAAYETFVALTSAVAASG
ncbi:PCP peridinin chlorophyll protein extrinsic protein [Amphidinium carterae]